MFVPASLVYVCLCVNVGGSSSLFTLTTMHSLCVCVSLCAYAVCRYMRGRMRDMKVREFGQRGVWSLTREHRTHLCQSSRGASSCVRGIVSEPVCQMDAC